MPATAEPQFKPATDGGSFNGIRLTRAQHTMLWRLMHGNRGGWCYLDQRQHRTADALVAKGLAEWPDSDWPKHDPDGHQRSGNVRVYAVTDAGRAWLRGRGEVVERWAQ